MPYNTVQHCTVVHSPGSVPWGFSTTSTGASLEREAGLDWVAATGVVSGRGGSPRRLGFRVMGRVMRSMVAGICDW